MTPFRENVFGTVLGKWLSATVVHCQPSTAFLAEPSFLGGADIRRLGGRHVEKPDLARVDPLRQWSGPVMRLSKRGVEFDDQARFGAFWRRFKSRHCADGTFTQY
jgi:hypothetical protein